MDATEERIKAVRRWLLRLRGRFLSATVCSLAGHRWQFYRTTPGYWTQDEPVGRCDRCRYDTGDFYGPDEGGWFR